MDNATRARAVTDEAIKRVKRHADPVWLNAAGEAVFFTCCELQYFIVDDVWKRFSDPDLARTGTHELRAMGPVIVKAAKAGFCRKTKTFRPSLQTPCHMNPRRVWESLIYGW
jgi:hypothetical protein